MNPALAPRLPSFADWNFRRPLLHTETLALIVSAFFALACNQRFWSEAMAGRGAMLPATWLFVATTFTVLLGIHFLLLCLTPGRWAVKPLWSLLIVATGFATYYVDAYNVYLDPGMLRSVFATEMKESRDLLVGGLVSHLVLYAGLPLALVWAVRLRRNRLLQAFAVRLATLSAAALLVAVATLLMFQDFSSLMRNHREMRYLVTPANFVYSSVRAVSADARRVQSPLMPVASDARLASSWQERKKPALFVMVVGETLRSANWGLSGYARQTTPQLAAMEVINFTQIRSCGTDTETSLPCMFSFLGRQDYDAARIRNSESLLHVLRRVGFHVVWRDNNTGCKGVCADIGEQRVDRLGVSSAFCTADEGCLDEALLDGLDSLARDNQGNLFVVLHQLGNHGPAYSRRYPDSFRRFTPTCDTAELRLCQRQEIVNAYDNAVLYTDELLARTIDFLKGREATYDTALLFVSDHGESLGENGIYLHGLPYAIAPDVQKQVPMIMWLSSGFQNSFQIDPGCLRQRAELPATHDNLVHTVMGMLQIETGAVDPARDLSAGCRAG